MKNTCRFHIAISVYAKHAVAAQSVAADGMMYMPFQDASLVMIDMRDAIEAAATVITTPGHVGQTYLLTGPAMYTFHDVANGLSNALGREVKYISVPMDAARQSMICMGLSAWVAEAYCEYFENYCAGGAPAPRMISKR